MSSDFVQLILMSSPVLASTSALAFMHILKRKGLGSRGRKLPTLYTLVTISIPAILIFLIGVMFTLFGLQMGVAAPGEIKIALGAIETFFAGYMGALAKSLYVDEN